MPRAWVASATTSSGRALRRLASICELRHDGVELGGGLRVFRLQDPAGGEVARHLELRQPGPRAVFVALRLAPAVFRAREAVMAREAIELGVLRPDRTLHPARETIEAGAEMRQLTDRERAHGFVRFGVGRVFPVARHRRAERFQLEHQIRVAGRDHFVVHELFGRPEVAGEALLGALHRVLGVVHAPLDGFVVIRVLGDVIPEPSGGRAVAGFAADAFGGEVAAAHVRRHVERVAQQALLRLLRVADAQDASHALRDHVAEHFGGARMTIL